MIEWNKRTNEVRVQCDSCVAMLEEDFIEEWEEVLALLKREGWRSRKLGEEWTHQCKDCWHKERTGDQWP